MARACSLVIQAVSIPTSHGSRPLYDRSTATAGLDGPTIHAASNPAANRPGGAARAGDPSRPAGTVLAVLTAAGGASPSLIGCRKYVSSTTATACASATHDAPERGSSRRRRNRPFGSRNSRRTTSSDSCCGRCTRSYDASHSPSPRCSGARTRPGAPRRCPDRAPPACGSRRQDPPGAGGRQAETGESGARHRPTDHAVDPEACMAAVLLAPGRCSARSSAGC